MQICILIDYKVRYINYKDCLFKDCTLKNKILVISNIYNYFKRELIFKLIHLVLLMYIIQYF